ncbi:hypothetical protein BB561_004343 [Smittium simulii]|uniref:CCHC-type domain-containing protein n=1 Tax=Smittium simulii TaxID=133385 RepID=A0A2T9YGT7_9FUNG|nr:hypothetical protein BB561_004343 [Smittium simulii]
MAEIKLNSLIFNMREKISTLDQNIQQTFMDRLETNNQDEYSNYTAKIVSFDKEKTAIKNELSILQRTLPKHIQPLMEEKDQSKDLYTNNTEDLYYVPNNMPKFRTGKTPINDIDEFISAFENCMRMNGLAPDVHGARLVASCLEYIDLQWLRNRVPASLVWVDMIPIMREIFGDPEKESKFLLSMWNMKPFNSESVTQFAKRFQKALNGANLPNTDQGAVKKFIMCLPDTIKWSIEAAIIEKRLSSDFISVSQFAMRFSNSNSAISEYSGEKKISNEKKEKSYCTFHKSNSHNTSECYTLKNKPSSSGQNSRTPTNSALKCFKCGSLQHLANACTTKNNQNIKKISQFPAEYDNSENINLVKEETLFSKNNEIKKIFVNANSNSDEFQFPITLCGRKIIAELDTAAEVSCISEKIVEEFEIPCNEVKGFNIMADANVKIPRTKETIEIMVQTDKTEISTKFEVISNLNNAQLLIGKDIIKKLNLDIFGLPYKYADLNGNVEVKVDEKEDLIQNVQTPIIKREDLDVGIINLLEENQNIDPLEPCNVPEAMVYLNTSTNSGLKGNKETEKNISSTNNKQIFEEISFLNQQTAKKQSNKFNAKNKLADYGIGSFVMKKNHQKTSKNQANYDGPFKIHAKTERNNYALMKLDRELLTGTFNGTTSFKLLEIVGNIWKYRLSTNIRPQVTNLPPILNLADVPSRNTGKDNTDNYNPVIKDFYMVPRSTRAVYPINTASTGSHSNYGPKKQKVAFFVKQALVLAGMEISSESSKPKGLEITSLILLFAKSNVSGAYKSDILGLVKNPTEITNQRIFTEFFKTLNKSSVRSFIKLSINIGQIILTFSNHGPNSEISIKNLTSKLSWLLAVKGALRYSDIH